MSLNMKKKKMFTRTPHKGKFFVTIGAEHICGCADCADKSRARQNLEHLRWWGLRLLTVTEFKEIGANKQ